MLKTIEQVNVFPISAGGLYGMYLSSKEHGAMTGMAARIVPRVGGAFWAFGGMLEGKFLQLVPGKLIVQSWRSVEFKKGDLNSTLVLAFRGKGKGCELQLVHMNVPSHDFKGVTEGWPKYYWGPMRAYLKGRK